MNHFVTYFLPGTSGFAETVTKPIDAWDVDNAVYMAGSVYGPYSTRPYGFRFISRARCEDPPESTDEIDHSPFYFLGGTIETLADIEHRNDKREAGVAEYMRQNNVTQVVVAGGAMAWTEPLNDGDIVLDVSI